MDISRKVIIDKNIIDIITSINHENQILEILIISDSLDNKISMDIPLTSINRISKNYLETCAVKLIAAMQWSDVELQNLYA